MLASLMFTVSWQVALKCVRRIPNESKAAKKIQEYIEKALQEEDCMSTDLKIERGVYVFDYWVDHKATGERNGNGNSSGN